MIVEGPECALDPPGCASGLFILAGATFVFEHKFGWNLFLMSVFLSCCYVLSATGVSNAEYSLGPER